MQLEKIAEILIGKDSTFVLGENLFIDAMPNSVTDAVLLLDAPAGTKIDTYVPTRKGRFQMIVRSTSRPEGKALSTKLISLMNLHGGQDCGDVRFFYIIPISEPISFPTAVSGLFEHSINFLTSYAIIG